MEASLVGRARAERKPRDRAGERQLLWAGALFALAVIVHNADHLRRGADALTPEVFWLGTAGIVLEVALVTAVFQRHWLAPLAAAVGGLSLAAGYLEVHFLPAQGAMTDSFTAAAHVSPLSWFAAGLEIVAALTLAAAGARRLRAEGGVSAFLDTRPDGHGFRASSIHPVVYLIVLSQAATLAVSFVQAYG